MTGFFIRPSRRADLAGVDALLARSYPRLLKADYPPSVLVTALPRISRAQPALVGLSTYFVAEQDSDGALIGAGGWTPDRSEAGKGHIRHVVSDDRTLRRGVGRALLDTTFASARAAGVTRMECWSTRTAEPFYAAMGFVSDGPIDVPLGAGISFPSVRMHRAL